MSKYIEGELHFDFPEELIWEELDKQGIQLPKGMALVDCVIERENDILLVEIKDPSDTRGNEKERKRYLKRLQEGSVITDELTPKIRDSFTFLHLMHRDQKELKYIVLLGLEEYDDITKKALLGNFKNQLLNNIKQETVTPWKKIYLKDCAVMTVEIWNQYFTQWPVTRVSQVGAQ